MSNNDKDVKYHTHRTALLLKQHIKTYSFYYGLLNDFTLDWSMHFSNQCHDEKYNCYKDF